MSACRSAICVAACTLLHLVCGVFGMMFGFCLDDGRIAVFVYAFVYACRLAACFPVCIRVVLLAIRRV